VLNFNLNYLDFYNPADCEKYIEQIRQNLILFNNRIENSNIRQALKSIISENTVKENAYEFKLLSLTYQILSELFKNEIARTLNKRDAELLGRTNARFQDVLEYIKSNYENQITLSKAIKIAKMSKGYFCTKFRQLTGKSFTGYLNQMRIEKAIMLILEEKESSITDIALTVGFEDINYFCRVFKKYMGQSPSSFKQGRQKDDAS